MVYVIFFKSSKGKWDDKAIDLVTGNEGYSHCELLVGQNKSVGAHYMDGGVVACEYNNIMADSRWDIWALDIPAEKVVAYMEKSVGEPYDLKGVLLTALTPIKIDVEGSKWCSELVAKALNEELGRVFNIYVMPNDLALAVERHPKSHLIETTKGAELNGGLWDWLSRTRPEIDRLGRTKKTKKKAKDEDE